MIAVPPGLGAADRRELLRRYGSFVAELSGRFWTGADVGTSAEDMDIISETGSPYIFSRTPARGGAGGSGPWTALGLFTAIEATCRELYGDPSLSGRRVLVQGAGSVGGTLVGLLVEAGAAVSVSDVSADAVRRLQASLRPSSPGAAGSLAVVPPEDVMTQPCDVFSPCALGGVLSRDTIPVLRCRAVVGGANNQLAEPGDAGLLAARGILYAPDFVVNAGGAMAITGLEAMGWSKERAEREVRGIGATLTRLYGIARSEGVTTEAAARRLADERLRAPGR